MDGFIVVDKPVGMSSHDVVNRVRRITGQRKAGHTGTLDPFATGVLPVALGEGTKVIPFLDESVKEYQAVLVFGKDTDTQDCTGTTVQEREWRHLDPAQLNQIIFSFMGNLQQCPPMYSALKHQGVPLYKLARRGISIERKPRDIEVFSIAVDRVALPEATITVRCSRGTYVRTLASDMGDKAGCGAHLLGLRRTLSGPFHIDNAISLDKLADLASAGNLETAVLSPLSVLSHLKDLAVTGKGVAGVRNGVPPSTTDILSSMEVQQSEKVTLSSNGTLVAVAQIVDCIDPGFIRLLRVFN